MQDYPLERLDGRRFQALAQSLLVKEYPGVQCFPLSGSDGGRDAVLKDASNVHVFQVKFWEPNPLTLPTSDALFKWVTDAIKGEAKRIAELDSKGMTRYILITNAQSTGHPGVGLRDRIQKFLDDTLPVPASCWWREDIEARLRTSFDLVMHFQLLQGPDALRALLQEQFANQHDSSGLAVSQRDERITTILAFLAKQEDDDRELRFTQAELDSTPIFDFFIDVEAEATQVSSAANTLLRLTNFDVARYSEHPYRAQNRPHAVGAAALLMHHNPSRSLDAVILEGAPGQGKSTLGQFVAQVHRVRILDSPEQEQLAPYFRDAPLQIPVRVDLRDFAVWLAGQHPFIPGQAITKLNGTLEEFLCFLISYKAGGATFEVRDLHALLSATPCLLVLDGLDEVPKQDQREEIIVLISDARTRLVAVGRGVRILVTTRPAIFTTTITFDTRHFGFLRLIDLDHELIFQYTELWLIQRKVRDDIAEAIRATLTAQLSFEHIANLTRNPMQLAILLYLIQRRSVSLPSKRTQLYSSYLDVFLDREAEKTDVVREHRELVVELHGYLAWALHSHAETGGTGRILETTAKRALRKYLVYENHDPRLVDKLFDGMVQRVVMLVSRHQDTYEFEVQPLREYFAARYLYEQAPSSSGDPAARNTRADRLDAISKRPYWLNVTRFFAGFYDKGELADLARRLLDLSTIEPWHETAYARSLILYMLGDHVFETGKRDVPALATQATDHLGLRTSLEGRARVALWPLDIAHLGGFSVMYSLPDGAGRQELHQNMRRAITSSMPLALVSRWADGLINGTSLTERISIWYDLEGVLPPTDWVVLGGQFGVLQTVGIEEQNRVLSTLSETQRHKFAIRYDLRSWAAECGDVKSLIQALNRPGLPGFPFGTSRRLRPKSSDSMWWPFKLLRVNASALSYFRESPHFGQAINEAEPPVDLACSNDIDAVKDLSDLLTEYGHGRLGPLTHSLDGYKALAGAVSRVLGSGWPVEATALVGATVMNRGIRGIRLTAGAGVDDLVEAARDLRLNASDNDLWGQWFEALPPSPTSNITAVASMLWADANVLKSHSKLLRDWVATLNEDDYEIIRDSIGVMDTIAQPGRARRRSLSMEEVDGIAAGDVSLRTMLSVRAQYQTKVADDVVAEYFSGATNPNHQRVIAVEVLSRLLAKSPRKKDEVNWLGRVSKSFSDAIPGRSVLSPAGYDRAHSIQEASAAIVLAAPLDYPDRVLQAADEVSHRKAASHQPAVSAVALKDSWFPAEIWPFAVDTPAAQLVDPSLDLT